MRLIDYQLHELTAACFLDGSALQCLHLSDALRAELGQPLHFLLDDNLGRHGSFRPYVIEKGNYFHEEGDRPRIRLKRALPRATISRNMWTPIALDCMIWLYLEQIEIDDHLELNDINDLETIVSWLMSDSFEHPNFFENAQPELGSRVWSVIDVRCRSVLS